MSDAKVSIILRSQVLSWGLCLKQGLLLGEHVDVYYFVVDPIAIQFVLLGSTGRGCPSFCPFAYLFSIFLEFLLFSIVVGSSWRNSSGD